MRIATRHILLAALTGAALLLGGCAVDTDTTPTSSATAASGDDLAARWADAWNAGDADAMAALFTSTGTYDDYAFQSSFTGPDGVATWVDMTHEAIGDVAIAVDEVITGPDRAVVRGTFSGHLMGAPTPFAVPIVTVIETTGDQISAVADYYNRADVLGQSGLPLDLVFE
ncbi:nuclear transport factor 2 family protein [Cellulomonas sp. Leaf334]|uniref:nuclear transport factor 2 family protein n=1 Tax=Cellulomonas sp. Leaf334 TaxID=1736339 RepID=UPI0006FB6471|nr:nuclear transport factor 2 family protein [Cellulomonas sp. Leaf334]KQR17357.1 hypothetical protein ASF78_08725 [Cellulomonas sp. Leaf334]